MKWKNESLLKFKSNFDRKYLFKMKEIFKFWSLRQQHEGRFPRKNRFTIKAKGLRFLDHIPSSSLQKIGK